MHVPGRADISAAAGLGDSPEMVATQAAGEIDTMDRDLLRVELAICSAMFHREIAVGQQEYGVGPQPSACLTATRGRPPSGSICRATTSTDSSPAYRPSGGSVHRASVSIHYCKRSPQTFGAIEARGRYVLVRSWARGIRSSSIMLPEQSTTYTKNSPRALTPKNVVCRQGGTSVQSTSVSGP